MKLEKVQCKVEMKTVLFQSKSLLYSWNQHVSTSGIFLWRSNVPVSGFHCTFHRFTTTWQVFADKMASSIQMMFNFINLLATNGNTRKLLVRQQATSCDNLPTSWGIHIFLKWLVVARCLLVCWNSKNYTCHQITDIQSLKLYIFMERLKLF